MTDVSNFEDQLIAEMRAHGRQGDGGPLAGHPLLIMTTRGPARDADGAPS